MIELKAPYSNKTFFISKFDEYPEAQLHELLNIAYEQLQELEKQEDIYQVILHIDIDNQRRKFVAQYDITLADEESVITMNARVV